MDVLLVISVLVHILMGFFGIFANGLIIYLVISKTPKVIRTYSMLILNCAFCDFLICVDDMFLLNRMIPGGGGMFYFSHGPCRYIGPFACFVGFSFLMHCYSYGLYSLVFSFCYRYYILLRPPPKIRNVAKCLILLYFPSFLQFVVFNLSSDSESVVKRRINEVFGYDTSTECVSGIARILGWKALLPALHVTCTITPAYIIILMLRKRIVKNLCAHNTMSQSTKHLQTQLLKAITCQAIIPAFYSFAVVMYSLGQLDILYDPLLEHFSLVMANFIPMLTPMASLYYIQPYRMWIRKNLLRSSTAQSSIASGVHTMSISQRAIVKPPTSF